MKLKKLLLTFRILLIVMVLALVSSVALSFILTDLSLVFYILAGVSFILILSLHILMFVFGSKLKKLNNKDLEKINEAIDDNLHNKRTFVELENSSNKELAKTAELISKLSIEGKSIENYHIYKKVGFLSFAKKMLDQRQLNEAAYLKFAKKAENKADFDKKIYEFIKENFKFAYFATDENEFDVLILNAGDRNSFEKKIDELKLAAKLAYYPDYSFNELEDVTSKEPVRKENGLEIYENLHKEVASYNELVRRSLAEKIEEPRALSDFMRESYKYLPFTHIVLKTEKSYLRQVNKPSDRTYLEYQRADFKYHEETLLFKYEGTNVILILASLNDISGFTYEENHIISEFKAGLVALTLPEIIKIKKEEIELRANNTLEKFNAYEYVINKDYEILEASKSLQEKFDKAIKGKKCHKVLFGLDKPCEDCPLKGKKINKLVTKLGSGNYKFEAQAAGENHQIYLTRLESHIISRKVLEERILDLVNADKRGYLLIFKIDFIDDLALKYKTTIEDITDRMLNILKAYSVDGNLYQKDRDEFVYIFEYASQAEVNEVATRISSAFEDKLSLTEKGVMLVPRTILLSYPLEVNSIFSLDSLSRTLFAQAERRGRLYRISTEPQAINRKRECLEVLENSLKNNNIPLKYDVFKDNKENKSLFKLHFDYYDEKDTPIREDIITLYAKLENLYFPLLERTMKCINFKENGQVIMFLSREALTEQVFAMINMEFKRRKMEPSALIIETAENYLKDHEDLYKKYSELGFVFGLGSIESKEVASFEIRPKYIRVDLRKLEKDKLYASRIYEARKKGIDLLVEEENTIDARYEK